MRSICLPLALVACVEEASVEPVAPNQLRGGDDKSDANGGAPLWAGLTSVTLERYVSDPCNDGQRALGDEPIHYDSWVRQRAGIRNICFEVWSPGVTDWDNPDFWKQLDVQVHWRFGGGGEFQHAYVNSPDRRGNNRRYVWTIDYGLDPLAFATTVPAVKVPLSITSETAEYANVTADLEVYFTVNGRALNAPSNKPFAVRYYHTLRKPSLAVDDAGYVLHEIVSCDGARFGWGAGYFAADVRDATAIAELGAGTDNSLLYGVPLARGAEVLSFTYSNQLPGNAALPGFSDSGGMRIVPDGTSMRVDLDVYDRALGHTRVISSTLANCVAN